MGRKSYCLLERDEPLTITLTALSMWACCLSWREGAQAAETNRRPVAVLEQASVDFEIVYIDDGSTDSLKT